MRKENIGKFMSVKDLTTYEVLKDEDLKGIKAKGKLLKHKKSGARVRCLWRQMMTIRCFQQCVPYTAIRQYGCTAYYGTFRTLRFHRFPGEGSVCGTGEGFPEYIFECHDLSGQDGVSGGKLQ